MNQEDINDAMWNSLPQWRKDQLTAENNPAANDNKCAFCSSWLRGKIGFVKDLSGEWLLSCAGCCEESGGAVREVDEDGQPGDARY